MTADALRDVMRVAVDHHRAGRLDDAEAAYRHVVDRSPGEAAAWHMLGLIASVRGDPAAAVDLIHRAVACRPDYPEAYFDLGKVYDAAGQPKDAAVAWAEAVRQRPTYANAHRQLGLGHSAAGRLDEAAAAFERFVALAPADAAGHASLGFTRLAQGRVGDAVTSLRESVRLDPDKPLVHSNLCYSLHYDPAATWPEIRAELDRWRQRFADPIRAEIKPHSNDRDPDRPIRLGYLSPDFQLHPVGFLLLPVLRRHDRSRFVVHAYSVAVGRDEYTDRIAAAVGDGWRDCSGWTDEAVADQIRADRIDVLVDLSLHSGHNRLRVVARKPTPVQVSWLGYPSSTGLDAVDYRFSDPVLDPPGTGEDLYTERTIRLPTYWCYAAPGNAPAVADPPAAKRGHVTFGCLNNFLKVNDPLLALWADLLRRVEGARLLLHSKPGNHWQATLAKFAAAGVDPARVSFVGYMPYDNYFRQYHNLDLALDTMPYGGGITTCDALYMGVPVVTRRGPTAVGRIAASMLTAVGLPDLIADTDADYVELAARLAADRPRLAELRRTLRERMLASPLMDASAFTAAVEVAYEGVWAAHCGSAAAAR